jgi:hypothetical protein
MRISKDLVLDEFEELDSVSSSVVCSSNDPISQLDATLLSEAVLRGELSAELWSTCVFLSCP